jgi:hypothetical protein
MKRWWLRAKNRALHDISGFDQSFVNTESFFRPLLPAYIRNYQGCHFSDKDPAEWLKENVFIGKLIRLGPFLWKPIMMIESVAND